jgi:hypothetical protein
VPVEGQSERAVTPLRPRDRHFLAALAIVGTIAIVAGVLYAAARGGSGPKGRCFSVTVPASVGGSTVTRCGAAAAAFCKQGATTAALVTACRRAGFPVVPPTGASG